VGRLNDVRANLRRAYQASRESVRAARAQARAEALAEEAERRAAEQQRRNASAQDEIEREGELAFDRADDPVTSVGPPADPDHEVPYGLRIAAAWSWRLLLLAAAAALALWVVSKLQLVVVPLAIALLMAALLAPLVSLLRRTGMPRSLATGLALITGLAAVAGVLTLVISQFIDGFPSLSNSTSQAIKQVQGWLQTGPLRLSDNQLNNLLDQMQEWLDTNKGALTGFAFATANTILHILTGLLLVLFATFFFLRDGRKISRFLVGVLPQPARDNIARAADESWSTLVSYVRATVLVAFIDAVGIGLALWILQVEFALPLAALVFLGAFIPIVGATLSGAVAVAVALVTRGPVIALIVLAAVIAIQQLEGHVLQPFIMGRAVAIHPLAVIIAIATGVILAGIIGALVAVPIVAVLNTAIRHLAASRRAAQARPALAAPPPAADS
jgi:predicted PurR-regulated permease PerM